jgi:hypothetical protein
MLRGGGRRLVPGRGERRLWTTLGRIRDYLTLTGRNTRSSSAADVSPSNQFLNS